MSRVRDEPGDDILDRLLAFTDEHGIDTIAELWSQAPARSLPGALWRIYLLRVLIRRSPDEASLIFQRGADALNTIDPVVAGAALPVDAAEMTRLADAILRGVFDGDFALALERAAAYCRISAAGSLSLAEDQDEVHPDRAASNVLRASRYTTIAAELASSARLWRRGSLD